MLACLLQSRRGTGLRRSVTSKIPQIPMWFVAITVGLCAPPAASVTSLLSAIAPLGFGGFDASAQQRKDISFLLKQLGQVNPNPQPATDLQGDWELLYSDAPDITGLINSGPFVRLVRIGQQIDSSAMTIANVIEYAPRTWLPLEQVGAIEDRLQQRVLLSYSVEDGGKRCKLKVAGLALGARKLLGVSFASAPPLTLRGPLELPFGEFECVYNDGNVRVVRTAQGYYSVNRRFPPGDGWDESR